MSSNTKTMSPSESRAQELYTQYVPVPETGALRKLQYKGDASQYIPVLRL